MRVQQFLAACGVASRRASEDLIRAGRVEVNGVRAALGATVEPDHDTVRVDGREVRREAHTYLLLNKPAGVVTTARDTHGRRTVLDCVAGAPAKVVPVGRLDLDTEGVLLLTNDGELANRLMHPRYGVPKTYQVWVRGHVAAATAEKLARGVELEDGMTAPAACEVVRAGERASQLKLTLREGRKREVKRMCEAVGHRVTKLRRIAFGPLHTGGLKPGAWRALTAREVAGLQRLTGLARD